MTLPQPRSRDRPRGRILAIDPGERRIGVAAADLSTRVAVPLTTIDVAGDPVEAVARLAEEQGAQEMVVGLALSLSGALGPQAQRAQALAEALADRLDIPVHTWDERLSSVEALRFRSGQARRSLARPDGPGRAPGRGRPARPGASTRDRGKRKGDVDAAAAAIILQAFLDSRPRPGPG